MDPIKLAVIGAGRRTCDTYLRIFPKLSELFEVVAVCDRVAESADAAAARLGVPSFHRLRDLAAAGVAEAALIATPAESHHAVSIFLSRAGLHHVCETPMAVTAGLCRRMISEAQARGVVLHVNEQFFRLPVIAFCRQLMDAGVIGPVGRITYFHGHTGYHNNSIWQDLAGGPPVAVNAVTHTMAVRRHLDGAGRWHDAEGFRLRVLHFGEGLLGVDMAGNIKSALGRCPRPGYLEIDGEAGAIVTQPYNDRPAPWNGRAAVRLVAEEDYERGAYAQSFPVERVVRVGHRVSYSDQLPHSGDYHGLRCRLPGGTVEWANPMQAHDIADGYLAAVAAGLLDFHGQLRRGGPGRFGPDQAAMSAEMESAFALSAERSGARVELPPAEEPEADKAVLESIRRSLGVDPADVDAMIDVAFPSDYVPRARV
ncbi:MAG: Gfo/Idh/MocA family protein [Planctomycetota bacterium]